MATGERRLAMNDPCPVIGDRRTAIVVQLLDAQRYWFACPCARLLVANIARLRVARLFAGPRSALGRGWRTSDNKKTTSPSPHAVKSIHLSVPVHIVVVTHHHRLVAICSPDRGLVSDRHRQWAFNYLPSDGIVTSAEEAKSRKPQRRRGAGSGSA